MMKKYGKINYSLKLSYLMAGATILTLSACQEPAETEVAENIEVAEQDVATQKVASGRPDPFARDRSRRTFVSQQRTVPNDVVKEEKLTSSSTSSTSSKAKVVVSVNNANAISGSSSSNSFTSTSNIQENRPANNQNGDDFYPGANVTGIDVNSDSQVNGNVTNIKSTVNIRFTAPAAPDKVAAWFASNTKRQGGTANRSGNIVRGTNDEGHQYTLTLSGNGQSTKAVLAVSQGD